MNDTGDFLSQIMGLDMMKKLYDERVCEAYWRIPIVIEISY
jgi:hypothetical protein